MSSQVIENAPAAAGLSLEHTVEEIRCYQVSFKQDGQVVGRAQLHSSASHILEVVDLFVEPEYRGRGYARHILAQLMDFARQQGASDISAHTTPRNVAAYQAFKQMGFIRHHDEVHLETPIFAKQTPYAKAGQAWEAANELRN
jgi:N-acetylglutamate synthase-like GNAT family acetyltransferase